MYLSSTYNVPLYRPNNWQINYYCTITLLKSVLYLTHLKLWESLTRKQEMLVFQLTFFLLKCLTVGYDCSEKRWPYFTYGLIAKIHLNFI